MCANVTPELNNKMVTRTIQTFNTRKYILKKLNNPLRNVHRKGSTKISWRVLHRLLVHFKRNRAWPFTTLTYAVLTSWVTTVCGTRILKPMELLTHGKRKEAGTSEVVLPSHKHLHKYEIQSPWITNHQLLFGAFCFFQHLRGFLQ